MEWRSDKLIKVLYLEDEDDDAELLRDYLHASTSPRFFVTHLRHAGQATEFLSFEDYDVVFCDYFLSLKGDYAWTCEKFLRELRRDRPETVAILTTDHTDLEQCTAWLRRQIEAGTIGFICKGLWTPRALVQLIEQTNDRMHGQMPPARAAGHR